MGAGREYHAADGGKESHQKAGLSKEQLDFLLPEICWGSWIATSFGLMELERLVFGVYGACSTIGESLLLASMALCGGAGNYAFDSDFEPFCRSRKAVSLSIALW